MAKSETIFSPHGDRPVGVPGPCHCLLARAGGLDGLAAAGGPSAISHARFLRPRVASDNIRHRLNRRGGAGEVCATRFQSLRDQGSRFTRYHATPELATGSPSLVGIWNVRLADFQPPDRYFSSSRRGDNLDERSGVCDSLDGCGTGGVADRPRTDWTETR